MYIKEAYKCSNYIFILDLAYAFSGLGKDNYKTRWETFKFWESSHRILEVWWYIVKNKEYNTKSYHEIWEQS